MTTVITTTVYCDRCNFKQLSVGHPSGNGWFLGTPWAAVNAGWGRWVGGYLHVCPECWRKWREAGERELKATRRKGPRLPLGGAS